MYDPMDNQGNEGQPFGRKENEGPFFEEGEKVRPARSDVEVQQTRSPAPRRRGCSRMLLASLIGALLCLGLGGLVGWQLGKGATVPTISAPTGTTPTYKNGSMTREQVIARVRPSVVQINVQRGQGGGLGSGEIIDQQGHIVTNYHVVADGQKFQVVFFDGSSLPARLTGVDPADDLAVIQVNPSKRLSPLSIGDSSQLEVGNDVLAVGNPLGITQTVTSGIVSALGRTIPEEKGGSILDAVQTDAAINPGNSGGALVNMRGELIGIPTLVPLDPEFKTPANGVGFAIPSNRVKFITPQLIQHGKVIHSGRPALGATVISVDPLVAAQAGLSVDRGALIVNVRPNSAAAQAGLQSGDVITQVNDTPVNNTPDLSDALIHNDPGSTITLNIVRGTQQRQVKVKLEEMKVP